MSGTGGDDLLDRIAATAERYPAPALGVAVSGGGDSTALLHLLAEHGRRAGTRVVAATVDHGLRAASAEEATGVARVCAGLGVQHAILTWTGWQGSGNLQDAARAARYGLLSGWARAAGLGQVWLGHTADDQAETFLLRLARGSGVDGLAAMPECSLRDGIGWVRPLLEVSRERLRDYLTERRIGWAEDPSNADPRFDRIRFRNAAEMLADLGLTRERLNATAAAMARARGALEAATADLAQRCARVSAAGEVVIGVGALLGAEEEIRLRLLAGALVWVSGAVYRPRLDSLEVLDGMLPEPAGTMTLHGCIARLSKGRLTLRREPARVAPAVPAEGLVWDGRWVVEGEVAGLMLGALGEAGLAQCGDWRATGLSREALLTTPALWRGEALVAAPLAGMSAGYTVSFRREFTANSISR